MSTEQPSPKLFAPWSAAAAAFLGMILAGAIVIAINYRRLGKIEAACQCLIIGLAISILEITWTISGLFPKQLAGFPMGILQAATVYLIAEKLQGTTFKEHIQNGGKASSYWWAFGIAFMSFIILMVTALVCWEVKELVVNSIK
jgi:formate-dependent nitrite reductase membrane component NrfD